MSTCVLDASALLAYLWQEPGHDTVAQHIEQSKVLMSSVNLSEVLSRAADKGMSPSAMAALQAALPFEIIPSTGHRHKPPPACARPPRPWACPWAIELVWRWLLSAKPWH